MLTAPPTSWVLSGQWAVFRAGWCEDRHTLCCHFPSPGESPHTREATLVLHSPAHSEISRYGWKQGRARHSRVNFTAAEPESSCLVRINPRLDVALKLPIPPTPASSSSSRKAKLNTPWIHQFYAAMQTLSFVLFSLGMGQRTPKVVNQAQLF